MKLKPTTNSLVQRCSFTFAVMSCLVLGCSSSDAPPLAEARGKITLKGKPLAKVGVTFFPTSGGPSAVGRTDEAGEFVMMTVTPGDGAPVGNHAVTLGAAEEGQGEFGAIAQIPQKYSMPNTSGLQAEVKDGQTNYFEFEVK